jgi:hypothetical protein
VRYLLLMIFPAVALADVSPPPSKRSNSASCLARIETARREFSRRVPYWWMSVVERDDGTPTYVACTGEPPETDCDMDATIARDPSATGKASGWRMHRKKTATFYEVEWTRSTS